MLASSPAKRSLFGPVDHAANKADFIKETESMLRQKSEEWSFDFVNMTPLSGGKYNWVRCDAGEERPSCSCDTRPSCIQNNGGIFEKRRSEMKRKRLLNLTKQKSTQKEDSEYLAGSQMLITGKESSPNYCLVLIV